MTVWNTTLLLIADCAPNVVRTYDLPTTPVVFHDFDRWQLSRLECLNNNLKSVATRTNNVSASGRIPCFVHVKERCKRS